MVRVLKMNLVHSNDPTFIHSGYKVTPPLQDDSFNVNKTPLMIAVRHPNKIDVVNYLVENNKVDVNQTDDSKNDALYYAIEKLN